jgi:putative oxidoreductase
MKMDYKPDTGILIFRVGMGVMMVFHGIMKIMGGLEFITKLGGLPPLIPENEILQLILGFIVVAFELFGGIGVILGYRFKASCIMIISIMIPAFLYHLGKVNDFESFVRNAWPLEIAIVFAAFLLIGPGEKRLGT